MDELVHKAKLFSKHYHTGQLYWDWRDYFIAHIEPVVEKAIELAEKLGLDITETAILAYLHDVLEDCEQVTSKMLEENFGKDILDGVFLLSNRIASVPNSDKSPDGYFEAIGRARPEIKIVKVADRLMNLASYSNHLDKQKRITLAQHYSDQKKYFEKYDIYPQLLSSGN